MKPSITSDLMKALHSVVRGVRKFAYSRPAPKIPDKISPHAPRIGLALGGGFARGIAHVGVLKVFVENGIPIHAVAGTSAGSIAAAAFASGCTVEEMVTAVRKLHWNKFARWRFSKLGFASNERMESLLLEIFRCRTFEQTRIPLAIVAADLATGEAVTFRESSLILPVRASCSFPGLFVPIEYRGRQLVDGVVATSLPVAPLREMGANVIVGVHLKGARSSAPVTNLFQVVGESFQIIQDRNQSNWRSECDLVIEPTVSNFLWDDFERADELVAAGEAAARAALPELRRLMQTHEVLDRATSKNEQVIPAPVLDPHASS